jgi:transcriptional regulator with XRE-family HTH domain
MSSMEELRAPRTKEKISQNALATMIGRSHTYVWNVEAGRVKLTACETIEAWAEALGIRPDMVYKAIGTVPHDIIEQLQEGDLKMWQTVWSLIGDGESDEQNHTGFRPVSAST